MSKTSQEFLLFLKTKGLKQTKQREAVLDVFLSTDKHVSIDEIFTLAKQVSPQIGYATVHRTLKLLTEAGLAREVDFGEGRKRYELFEGRAHHDHLICIRCGKLIEVLEPQIEALQEKLAKRSKFKTAWHRLEIFGHCQGCS